MLVQSRQARSPKPPRGLSARLVAVKAADHLVRIAIELLKWASPDAVPSVATRSRRHSGRAPPHPCSLPPESADRCAAAPAAPRKSRTAPTSSGTPAFPASSGISAPRRRLEHAAAKPITRPRVSRIGNMMRSRKRSYTRPRSFLMSSPASSSVARVSRQRSAQVLPGFGRVADAEVARDLAGQAALLQIGHGGSGALSSAAIKPLCLPSTVVQVGRSRGRAEPLLPGHLQAKLLRPGLRPPRRTPCDRIP